MRKKINKKLSNKRYVNTVVAAKILCKSPGTLAQERYLNYGPKYIKLPGKTGKVLYDVLDLHEYLASHKVQPANEAP